MSAKFDPTPLVQMFPTILEAFHASLFGPHRCIRYAQVH